MARQGRPDGGNSRLRARLRRRIVAGMAGIALAGLGLGVAEPVIGRDVAAWKMRVNLLASAAGAYGTMALTTFVDPYAGVKQTPSCNCSTGWPYYCPSPESPYLQRVRQDPRVAPLVALPAHRLDSYAQIMDSLRDRFPHGTPSPLSRSGQPGVHVLEMLDEADRGERFLCGDISKMFIQLVHAAGGFARRVSMVSEDGSGHVVAEAWVQEDGERGRWVVFDSDYDVYFVDAGGTPLGAQDLHRLHREGRTAGAIARPGSSHHAVYQPQMHAFLLGHYHELMFSSRANFATVDLPRWHPRRHPSRVISLVRDEEDAGIVPRVYVRDVLDDPSVLDFVPCRTEPSREIGRDLFTLN